jgi:Zn-dependent membrane protease YugP
VFAILQLWWPVLVLVHLPLLVNTIAVTMFKRIAHTHDWELPDDLPQTAGDWLRDRGVARGLRVIVTDGDDQLDGFHPDHRVIQLSAITHFKSDPVYWAIAAHELGHARFHAEHPLLGTLSRVAQWLKQVFLMLGASIAIGNVLYARPRGLELAFAFLAGSLLLRVVELLEEAYASWIAYRELTGSAHLTPVHLRAVRRSLLGALGTYLSIVATGAFLLSQWSIVERITGEGRLGELGELTTLGWIVVISLCVIGIAYAVFHVLAVAARPVMHGKLEHAPIAVSVMALIWRLLLIFLVVLVWDLQSSATWAWCVILAIAGAQKLIVLGLMIPLWYPALKLAYAIQRWFSGPGHHASDELAASQAAGRPLILHGKSALLEIAEYQAKNPSAGMRAFDLLRLSYLPLIVAIGGGLIT